MRPLSLVAKRGLSGIALIAACASCHAQTRAAIYLIESDPDATHLSNRSGLTGARLVVSATPDDPPATTPARLPAAVRAADPLLARIVREAADHHALDPRLVHAVIDVESGYSLRATSPRGAQGLMQLMPATAREYGVSNPFDAQQNVSAGARHLRRLLDQFGQDMPLALAAYNAGAAAVARYGNAVPPFAETTTYVRRVLQRFDAARQPSINHPA